MFYKHWISSLSGTSTAEDAGTGPWAYAACLILVADSETERDERNE